MIECVFVNAGNIAKVAELTGVDADVIEARWQAALAHNNVYYVIVEERRGQANP